MTNEDVRDLILAFNAGAFPSFAALRPLSDTVTLGYIWSERPTGRVSCESSRKTYFVMEGPKCVGVVVEMGFAHSGNPWEEENLHWYMLEEHRGQGHLCAALRDYILPYIFSDGRASQRVTADSESNAHYVARQGFTRTGELTFTMSKEDVDLSRVPEGRNTTPTRRQVDELKERLREAKGLIASVSERLRCHYGRDSLGIGELADDIEDCYASRLSDLPIDYTSAS